MAARFLLMVALVWCGGCVNTQSRLVGVWEFDEKLSSRTGSLGQQFERALGSGVKLEFNDKNRFRMTFVIVEIEGDYRVNGDTVTLLVEDKDEIKLKLSRDGQSLTRVKEFPSDGDLVYRKVQP